MSYKGLGHPPGFDWASGFPGAGRVLQTIHTRLGGCKAIKPAHCKRGDLAVDSHRTDGVRVPQGPSPRGPYLGLLRSQTPYLLMLGWETGVPDHLTYHIPEQHYSIHEYASELVEKMRVAHEILREKQWQVRQEDSNEPLLYQVGDWVWMVIYRRRHGQAAKSQPKFVGPYAVVEVMPNHTYKLERSG